MPESRDRLSDDEKSHWVLRPGRFIGIGMSQKTCLYCYVYAATEYGTGVRAQGLFCAHSNVITASLPRLPGYMGGRSYVSGIKENRRDCRI